MTSRHVIPPEPNPPLWPVLLVVFVALLGTCGFWYFVMFGGLFG